MPQPRTSHDWLTLPQASTRLGISPQTLRQWSDQGVVPSFRTPGGHRRFRASDLAQLESKSTTTISTQPLRVLAHAAIGRTRLALSDGRLANEAWFRNSPTVAREQQRALGRRVVMTLSELLPLANDDVLVARAHELGAAYGQLNSAYRVPLQDALRAFLFFRETFFESLIELAETAPALDALGLSRRMSRFVDEMLLTLLEFYDNAARKRKK